MMKYELWKIFSKSRNRIAVILMLILCVVIGIMTVNRIEYVDENGNSSTGIVAARNLKSVKNQWSGYLTEEVFQKALRKNRQINASKEARSDDIQEQNKAFAKGQEISGVLDVIRVAFSDYRDYNYYAADSVTDEEAATVYDRRITTLKDWLDSGEEDYSDAEKAFLIRQYETLDTPFYYEYFDGWSALLQIIPTYLLVLALIIGFLVSGIFSEEFQTKADAIFFSSKCGRNKAIAAKAAAGVLIITVFYFVFVLLYTAGVLMVIGADGAGCPIQLDFWRSVYHITIFQAYLFIIAGGYIGTLLASSLAMLISAYSRSTAMAMIVPFIILCAFPFLSRIITLPGVCTLFPDQLMEIYIDLKESALFEIGGRVVTSAMIITPLYTIVSLILYPVIYQVYKRTEVK